MKFEIEFYDGLPCEAEIFIINDVKARIEDFGETINTSNKSNCCSLEFEWKTKNEAAMEKYDINLTEYLTICKYLEKKLVMECCMCI